VTEALRVRCRFGPVASVFLAAAFPLFSSPLAAAFTNDSHELHSQHQHQHQHPQQYCKCSPLRPSPTSSRPTGLADASDPGSPAPSTSSFPAPGVTQPRPLVTIAPNWATRVLPFGLGLALVGLGMAVVGVGLRRR